MMMNASVIILLIGACVLVAGAPQASGEGDGDGEFSLKPTKLKERTCKAPDGREGICVDEGTCSEKFNIELGGMIDESELRIGTCGGEDWCCVHPNMSLFITKAPESSTPPTPRGCRTGLKDSCPWCVAVYRNNPRDQSPLLFCGGAVVGSRIVLTAASCALAHKHSDLWVQLPGTSRRYAVNTAIKHKQFNSGTREHDIALLLLNEDVEWPEGHQDNLGACLGLKTALEGECVALGFDEADKLVFTPVTVTANSCSNRGSSYDAACGRAKATCAVAPGSPVLCPSDSTEMIVAGLVRQACMKDSTILGSLVTSAEWLTEELTKLALAADRYRSIEL